MNDDLAYALNDARTLMRNAYRECARRVAGRGEDTVQDTLNLDVLDDIVMRFIVPVTDQNAIDQLSPRALFTLARIEEVARSTALGVLESQRRAAVPIGGPNGDPSVIQFKIAGVPASGVFTLSAADYENFDAMDDVTLAECLDGSSTEYLANIIAVADPQSRLAKAALEIYVDRGDRKVATS